MSKYSDWRSDLREVMDDDVDEKKVTGKGVNNNKLIKINPKLGEAVEQIGGQILEVTEVDTVDGEEEEDKSKKFEKEKQDKIEDKNKKKEMMLKKRIVRMKMMAVNQGAGDSLVAHHEPEGEELTELSKRTLGNYVKDASSDAAMTSMHHGNKPLAKDAPKREKKILKRLSGIRKATDKLSKEEIILDYLKDRDLPESIVEKLSEEQKTYILDLYIEQSENINGSVGEVQGESV